MSFDPKGDGKSKQFEHKGPASVFTAKTVTGPAIYHFGIIDFLQNWTFEKQVERAFKIYFLRKDPDGLSVMHPLSYKTRFQSKLEQIFDLDGSPGGIGGNSAVSASTVKQPNHHDNLDMDDCDVSSHLEMIPTKRENIAYSKIPFDLENSLVIGKRSEDGFGDFDDF